MAIYLGLGSNLGARRKHLRQALAALEIEGIRVERVSPVVESPALLPAAASPDWNMPFLNLVVRCQTELAPSELLAASKRIEAQQGRSDARRWAPRPIDIDILVYDGRAISTQELTIPHAGLHERPFWLAPLAALDPGLAIPGLTGSARDLARRSKHRIPLWMGIINLTPDSFSDGGRHASWPAVAETIDAMLANGVQYLDFGAESTRPGATPLTADEEWLRLEPMLTATLEKLAGDQLRPAISIDTYHASVAAKAIELGADMINDVAGLTDPEMLSLAAETAVEFVAMHNLGLPADPARTLATSSSAVDQVDAWLDRQLDRWQQAGVALDRIVFDPGIGFGKNPLQSLELLRHIDRFQDKGLRLLVGHSRKSFMHRLSGDSSRERDLITIGGSLALCDRGVDILRVHNVGDHVTAYRGWSHLQTP
jgi:2-amino-4-hydroxy-6-hydroxymethyldihydropteridine diphosphokinase/dihydropteroate synthase